MMPPVAKQASPVSVTMILEGIERCRMGALVAVSDGIPLGRQGR